MIVSKVMSTHSGFKNWNTLAETWLNGKSTSGHWAVLVYVIESPSSHW